MAAAARSGRDGPARGGGGVDVEHGAASAAALTWHSCVPDECLGLEAAYSLEDHTFRLTVNGCICDVAMGRLIASGGFGRVKHTSCPEVVAKQVKLLRKEPLDEFRVSILRNEMKMLHKFKHLYAWSIPPKGTLTIFMRKLGDCDLFELMEGKGRLSRRAYFLHTNAVLAALVDMQAQTQYGKLILHRDIKPENIIVSTELNERGRLHSVTAALADVAFAVDAAEHWDGKSPFFTYPGPSTGVGTLGFVPFRQIGRLIRSRKIYPGYGVFWRHCERTLESEGGTRTFDGTSECVEDQTRYCASTDLYATGVVICEMLTRIDTRSFVDDINPFIDFMARACSMRQPIPATWVLAAARATERDYLDHGGITDESIQLYQRYILASGLLAGLAGQRAAVDDDQREALEIKIAALYAKPLDTVPKTVMAAGAKKTPGTSPADALLGGKAGHGTVKRYGGLAAATSTSESAEERGASCRARTGRISLWLGVTGSAAAMVAGVLELAGVFELPPGEGVSLLGAGASALTVFSCCLCCETRQASQAKYY